MKIISVETALKLAQEGYDVDVYTRVPFGMLGYQLGKLLEQAEEGNMLFAIDDDDEEVAYEQES